MNQAQTLGFIGLGVMGSRMCANLIRKSGTPVFVYDPVDEAVADAVAAGAIRADTVEDVGLRADVVFLSLPSIDQVEIVARQLASGAAACRVIVDMSTSDVARTRALAGELAARDVVLIDAPVARLRQAAEEGTLLITVGASAEHFEHVRSLLECMGSDIIQAGGCGNGQVMKILNNMVLFVTMNTLAEAIALGRAAGVDGETLFTTLAMGSADSFALRKTGTATLVPDHFPERAFPVNYAIKDMALALALAAETNVSADAAHQTMELLKRTRDAGYGDDYYPVMVKLLDGRG